MSAHAVNEVYSPGEVARAIGVPEADVREALARQKAAADFITHAGAVRLGRALGRGGLSDPQLPKETCRGAERSALFSLFTTASHERRPTVPIAVSGTLHAALITTFMVATSMGLSTRVTAEIAAKSGPRLVFISTPGPGDGGGGGGRLEPALVARALRSGQSTPSRPVPERRPPAPSKPSPQPQLLEVEPLPTVVSPVASLAADPLDRTGGLEDSPEASDSHGPSVGGGAGRGTGSGIGSGAGPGAEPGTGGGFGGGPFRPGSGVEPPRLLQEVKADYTQAARRAGVEGEVVLEVLVRRDGSVGDIKLLQRLGYGLDERAVAAIRAWQFAPATRAGVVVAVIVEIAVEFRLT